MKILSEASARTTPITRAGLAIAGSQNPGIALGLVPLVLGVSVAAFTVFAATETGLAIVRELKRRQRLREKLPESPSLRGAPTPAELSADIGVQPRTLLVRLRLGSRLADLEPTLDNSTLGFKKLGNGQKRIKSRAPGMKGWLADRRIPGNYSTLVRYKKLAQRLRQLLSLDDRLPLEWLLPDAMPDRDIPADFREQYASARRRLARLLNDHRNFARLKKHVEAKLGIPRLLSARRTGVRSVRDHGARCASHAGNAMLPPAPLPRPDLVEATKRELIRFLREKDLPPKSVRLREQVLAWLHDASARQPAP